jgi:hypothetical protein
VDVAKTRCTSRGPCWEISNERKHDRLATTFPRRDGHSIQQWSPRGNQFEIEAADVEANLARTAFYLARVKQADGHRGWTSPIWFG